MKIRKKNIFSKYFLLCILMLMKGGKGVQERSKKCLLAGQTAPCSFFILMSRARIPGNPSSPFCNDIFIIILELDNGPHRNKEVFLSTFIVIVFKTRDEYLSYLDLYLFMMWGGQRLVQRVLRVNGSP